MCDIIEVNCSTIMRLYVCFAIFFVLLPAQAFSFAPPSFDSQGAGFYPQLLKRLQHEAADSALLQKPTTPLALEEYSSHYDSYYLSNLNKSYVDFAQDHCGGLDQSDCLLLYTKKRYGGDIVDLSVLAELNSEAANIWGEILGCSNGDPQLAKETYRIGNFCKSDLRSRIFSLRDAVHSLAISAFVVDSFGFYVVRKIHPLLTQIVIEENLKENYYRDWKKELEGGNAANSFRMGELVAMIQQEKTYASTVGSNRDLLQFIETSRTSDVYPIVRRMLFYNHYLDLLDKSDCSQWGLWPKSAMIALNFHGSVATGDFSFWYDGSRMSRIQKKIVMACGKGDLLQNISTAQMAMARIFAEIPKAQLSPRK